MSSRSHAPPSISAGEQSRARPEPAAAIPVLRPKLPSAAQLAPFLRGIDERRLYSNGGPLALQLQTELSRHLGCPEDTILATASATAGLTAALLALDLPENSVCLMPSWTFAATPHAARSAGLRPWFFDVDARTWALDPAAVREFLVRGSCPARAVVVVSPFGAPLDLRAWEKLQNETGVCVVVDAAAGFDTVRFSSLLTVVSLHATKIFAAGEGGFVVAPSAGMRNRVGACANFGFAGTREAQCRAINAKMSEYHAAIALANFTNWPEARLRHLEIAAWYREALKKIPGVATQPGFGEGWACGVTNVLLEGDAAESIGRYLLREGVETRAWWGEGCHRQAAFADCPREPLPVTEFLGSRVLGLPHYADLPKAHVSLVVQALGKALRSRAAGRRRASFPKIISRPAPLLSLA